MTDTSENIAKRRIHIKTWGCQMNVYDSARMVDVVAPLGYAPTDDAAEADLVVLNTCHIREKATDKLFSELGRLREQQQERAKRGEKMLIAVAGCVAQAEGQEIQRRAPYVDMVFGPQTYHQLPEMIAKITRGAGRVLNTDFPAESKFDHLPDEQRSQTGVSAFLSIQEGCDKFCSFCVVPYTRGAEYARPMPAIIAEATRLTQNGAREITLLGQNVNAWHDGEHGLAGLLARLAENPDIKRLRYTTSHPRDMDDALIAAHRDIPKLMPFLHLPVQSGSDVILNAMNRKHAADDYRRIVEKMRNARPDIGLSTDIIVGFPGESDADFAETMRLVRDVDFALAYSFKYSRRPGTPAAAMTDQIDEAVKDARLQELQSLLREQQERFNVSKVGQTVPVLFDDVSRRENKIFGRTPWMQAVHVAAPERLIGQEEMVRITSAGGNSLDGEML